MQQQQQQTQQQQLQNQQQQTPQQQQQQQQQQNFNIVYLCRYGQETVQDIVSRFQEVFSTLKSVQPPIGTNSKQNYVAFVIPYTHTDIESN